MEIAAEVGIGKELLQRAQEKWEVNRSNRFNPRQAGYHLGFKLHVIPYIFVSVFLIFLNMTTSRYLWCIYPILGWGLGVVVHGSCVNEISNKNQCQFNVSK